MRMDEGLLEHDLDYTIMPLISIDEYESKIDDRKAIVIGFYVTERDPAVDLAAFIEKGVVRVLDTDVSPAPTDDGHYLVFVEIDRDDRFPERLIRMVAEIGNITNVDEWEFSPLHSKEDENYPLTVEELEKRVNLDPDEIEIDDEDATDGAEEMSEHIAGFLRSALVESFGVDGDDVTLGNARYRITGFADGQPEIPVIMASIGDPRIMESNRLQRMLGQAYQVYVSGNGLLVTKDDAYLLLQPVD